MKHLWLWIACLGLVGCASYQPPLAEVQRFDQIVQVLASPSMEGRGAGYAGLDQARDYLVNELEQAGLEPGLADGAYTQAIDIPLGVSVEEQTLAWSSGEQSSTLVGGREDDFSVLGFSASKAFEGQAVFVGYAITSEEHHYDSLAGQEELFRGGVAIAYRYEPMDDEGQSQWADGQRWTEAASLVTKAKWAQDRGAIALLLVNPPSQDAGGSLRSARETSFEAAVDIPVFQIRGDVFAEMLEASGRDAHAAMRVYEEQADAGEGGPDLLAVTITGSAALEHRQATIHNVAGIVPGVGILKNQTVVVGAHYDHLGFGEIGSLAGEETIHPGADDNASGTAAMVMLASRWAQRATSSTDTNRRTLVFVGFSGEERGLLGSAHFVKNPELLAFDLTQTTAMINFDMVGRLQSNVLYLMGGGSGEQWNTLLKHANRQTRLKLEESDYPIGPSDHTHFYLAEIPVMHFFTGVHEDYHRPTDTPNRINATGGATVVDLADALIAELAVGEPVTYVAVETKMQTAHTGKVAGDGGAYLGILPNYASLNATNGCLIDHVTPNSPAAIGQMKDGDLIVKWNQTHIQNLQKLSDQLKQTNPGEHVAIIIKRKGVTHILDITLGER